MQSDLIHVAAGGDANIAHPFVAMVGTLLAHLGDHALQLHVLDAGLKAAAHPAIDRLCTKFDGRLRVNWYPASEQTLSGLPACGSLPPAAFMRLLLPELLQGVDRVLWLDCDTLVNHRIDALWKVDLAGCPAAAVRDYGFATINDMLAPGLMETMDSQARLLEPLNSGVMVIDLSVWRKERIGQAVLELSKKHARSLVFADQDGLNVVLAGRWKRLDLAWNVQLGVLRHCARLAPGQVPDEVFRQHRELSEHPWILHFSGPKPWNTGLLNPFRGHYFSAVRDSGMYSPMRYYGYYMKCSYDALAFFISRRVRHLMARA